MDDRQFNTYSTGLSPAQMLEMKERYGEYSSQTHRIPRPTEETSPFHLIRDPQKRRDELSKAQGQWDAADAKRKELEDWVAQNKADREAKAQAARDALEAADLEKRQAERAQLAERLKREYLASPAALPSDWTPELEARLVTEHLIDQAGMKDAADRQAFSRISRQAW